MRRGGAASNSAANLKIANPQSASPQNAARSELTTAETRSALSTLFTTTPVTAGIPGAVDVVLVVAAASPAARVHAPCVVRSRAASTVGAASDRASARGRPRVRGTRAAAAGRARRRVGVGVGGRRWRGRSGRRERRPRSTAPRRGRCSGRSSELAAVVSAAATQAGDAARSRSRGCGASRSCRARRDGLGWASCRRRAAADRRPRPRATRRGWPG